MFKTGSGPELKVAGEKMNMLRKKYLPVEGGDVAHQERFLADPDLVLLTGQQPVLHPTG